MWRRYHWNNKIVIVTTENDGLSYKISMSWWETDTKITKKRTVLFTKTLIKYEEGSKKTDYYSGMMTKKR